MDPEGSLPCSQVFATGLCSEPDASVHTFPPKESRVKIIIQIHPKKYYLFQLTPFSRLLRKWFCRTVHLLVSIWWTEH